MNYWVMLHFREALLICKIEFWCELTIATTCGSCGSVVDLCFGQKYTLLSMISLIFGGGQDLDIRSMFRIEFLICE